MIDNQLVQGYKESEIYFSAVALVSPSTLRWNLRNFGNFRLIIYLSKVVKRSLLTTDSQFWQQIDNRRCAMNRGTAHLLVLLTLLIGAYSESRAQDPQYTQFYSNHPLLNPALTGAASGPRVSMNYRAQWVAIPGSFRQTAISYDQPINSSAHGVGGTIHSDRAGEGNLSKIFVNLNYSFNIQFGKRGHEQNIRLGLGGGIEQANIEFNKLRFGDQIDPREGFINATTEASPDARINPDVNFGAVYYNRHAWVGLSVHHLTEPTQSLLGQPRSATNVLPRRYTFVGGFNIPIGPPNDPESVSVSPALIFMNQRNFNQLSIGTYFNLDPIVFGVWWRSNYNNYNGDFASSDMIAGLIGFREGIFSIGYSYDYTISQLTNGISGGSHELAVVIEFERNKSTTFKHRKLPCPRF